MTLRDPDARAKHAADDGAVPPWWSVLDRRRLAVALGSTFVAVPVVVLDNVANHRGAEAEAVEVVAPPADEPDTTTTSSPRTTVVTVQALAAPTTTTTTSPPAAPAPTAQPEPVPEPEPAPPPTAAPVPTTAAPPPTTAPPVPAPATIPAGRESGQATWYRYRDGECAHKTLPRGTVVTVTNTANGATATCLVTDRGPYGGNRVIDLDDATFAQLAPLSAGVITVTLTW